mmetsp:Transcript_810/g.1273  ORF Transcript_810/g.1273 Transcript_810/m.1273 type:complete len:119 (+) Transcript_810:210-566(+)
MQEMSSAVECIREIFPASAIKTVRVDKPFRVTISASVPGKSAHQHQEVVWTCKQHNLFEKNPKRRRRAMDSIRQKLAAFKEELATRNHHACLDEETYRTITQVNESAEVSKTPSVAAS